MTISRWRVPPGVRIIGHNNSEEQSNVAKAMIVYALPPDVTVDGAPEYFLPVAPKSSDPQELLPVRAVARQLGVGPGEVKELIQAGLIKATRDDDDTIVIRQKELDRFVGQLREVELVEKEIAPPKAPAPSAEPAKPERERNPSPRPPARSKADEPAGKPKADALGFREFIPGVDDADDGEVVPLLLIPARLVGRVMDFLRNPATDEDAEREPEKTQR